MKKLGLALALFATVAMGNAALAAQPGLSATADNVQQETASRDCVSVKYPSFIDTSFLRQSWMNATIETEVSSFESYVRKLNETGSFKGYVSYEVGYVGDDWVSVILYESIMPEGAAHPSTTVKGLTFDHNGYRLTRADVLSRLPAQSSADIQNLIETQTKARNLPIFEPKDWSIHTWPQEFYIGQDKHIHFIFQQYDIAPYAAGWISIDTGVTPDLK